MNFEEAQNFTNAKAEDTSKQEELKQKAAAEKEKAAREFLKTRKIFKDLLANQEAVDTYKKCRDFLLLEVLVPQIGANDVVNDSFAAGYRTALDTLTYVVETYDTYAKEYNEVKGGN